ncbi:MAG: phosphoadenylyl-sulfate reductase [Acidimicrobiales bacterium]
MISLINFITYRGRDHPTTARGTQLGRNRGQRSGAHIANANNHEVIGRDTKEVQMSTEHQPGKTATLPDWQLMTEQSHEDVARMERASAQEVIRWAVQTFGSDLVLASSFQDCVLIDLAVREDPMVQVVFLDTCYHFPETLEFVDQVRARYDLNLRVISPGIPIDEWPCGTERCCELRKVEPLRRALEGKRCWMTGLKRVDSPSRASSKVVSFDADKRVVKVNPLAAWTDEDVEQYVADQALLQHPLTLTGYASIGCAPTTTPVTLGAHPRSGRWSGTGKTECGLHY